jgi:diacylglycerol kinase (ATP)
MNKFRIIANPIAGKGAGITFIPQIDRTLRDLGLDFEIACTEYPWHAAELAKLAVADGCEVIVAAGGDGTCNEVLNGLVQAQKEGLGSACMGVLCIGRGNDFAFGMGVPRDLQAGCQALADDNRRLIDVGEVKGGLYPEGRYFGNGVGIGFDAVVGFVAAKMVRLNRHNGFLSYLIAAIKTITLYYTASIVKIEYDGQSFIQPSLMVSIMNGRRMGGGFMMAPNSKPDDRLFDMCIAREMSRISILRTMPSFFKGTQGKSPHIWTGRANQVVITSLNGNLPAHSDGETLCTEGHQLKMSIYPRQFELIYKPDPRQ